MVVRSYLVSVVVVVVDTARCFVVVSVVEEVDSFAAADAAHNFGIVVVSLGFEDAVLEEGDSFAKVVVDAAAVEVFVVAADEIGSQVFFVGRVGVVANHCLKLLRKPLLLLVEVLCKARYWQHNFCLPLLGRNLRYTTSRRPFYLGHKLFHLCKESFVESLLRRRYARPLIKISLIKIKVRTSSTKGPFILHVPDT